MSSQFSLVSSANSWIAFSHSVNMAVFNIFSSALSQIGRAGVDAIVVTALEAVGAGWRTGRFRLSLGTLLKKVLTAMAGRAAELLTPTLLSLLRSSFPAIPAHTLTR